MRRRPWFGGDHAGELVWLTGGLSVGEALVVLLGGDQLLLGISMLLNRGGELFAGTEGEKRKITTLAVYFEVAGVVDEDLAGADSGDDPVEVVCIREQTRPSTGGAPACSLETLVRLPDDGAFFFLSRLNGMIGHRVRDCQELSDGLGPEQTTLQRGQGMATQPRSLSDWTHGGGEGELERTLE